MKKLGKFEIIEKVGQGAMGVVYKARDPFIDRIVALKTLTTGLSDDANLLKRFYSEARSAGGLQHPNIVTIYELGHEGDTPFIAMQFLTGESLDKILDRRPSLPLSQKIGFIVYVCRALEYAHKQNPPVVHRDIKPGNVMVTTEGAVVVVDFGIARLGEGTRSQSAGMLIGTLGYMSPQLFRNGTADARSDIWATGVMFYELLAYRRPFEGDNAAALMSNIILEKPRSIADAAPGTPQDLQAVVERMLAKEAEARYQNMEEVLLELEPIWRRLQQAEVSDLLANSQQLYESGDLENAKAKVSQIIQIDTSNTQAKSLLEKINAEVRRKQVVPQMKARVENAGKLLANGQVEDAKAEAEAALKLDSTYQPAREVLGQVQAALERAHNITQALRTSKQRMAEGALTEAELQLDRVLEIDPGNAAAREQLKQIREERSRRERRKQRDEALHRARTLWTNLQYEECISLLIAAQKQFPGDSEITKLLESARQDQTEQQRQSLLTEARNLLSAQRFDDSLRALDLLLERYPADATAKNLRTHALQGRNQQRREQRLAEGKSNLRAWVKEGKYTEAITHAGQLSKEFPDDFELKELLDFARTEFSQLEQKHHLEQSSKQIQQALKDGRFFEAIQSAEKALLEFPKNLDLLILLDRARKEQSEKERHELLKQRLREVERMVDRQELTDAIDLARQTLATVGQDSRLADTLLKAEREIEFREQRKRQQNDTVQMAQTLLEAGNFAGATSVLKVAIETQLLPANDPRLAQLLNEIAARKEPPPSSAAATAAAAPGVGPSATLLGSPISTKPSADPGKDYVYQRGTHLPGESLPSERDVVASAYSPTIITGPSAQPVPPPAPPVIRPATEKKEKKKRSPESAPAPIDASATQMFSPTASPEEVSSQLFAPEIELEQPAVVKRPPRTPTPQRTIEPSPEPIPRPLWKNPLVVAALGVVLIASLGGLIYSKLHPAKVEPPVISKVDQATWNQAEQLMAASPRRFAEALYGYQSLVTNKSLGAKAQERIREIEGLQKQESDWMTQGAEAQGAKKYDEALKDYEQAKQINGDHEKDAEVAIEVISNLEKGKTPAEIAQENFKQADRLALQKQWAAAKSRYQQVKDAADVPPELRNSAAGKMAVASAHIEEEDLWARAKAAHDNHEIESAKQLAQQVAAKRLDHRAQAQALLQQLDRELTGASEASADERRFLELKQQFESARTTGSVADLNGLKAKFQTVAGAGGKHADEARQIVNMEIPKLLNDIDSGNRRDQQEKLWGQLVGEYKTALEANNRTTMQSVKDRLSPFQNGPHAPEAQQYVKRLEDLMKAEPPQPPKTTPVVTTNPPVNPADDAKPAIAKVFDDLSRAFANKDIRAIKQLWPSIPKQQADKLEASFHAAKTVSRKFTPVTLTVSNNDATATGTYSSSFVLSKEPEIYNGSFKAVLKRNGNIWIITGLTM